MGARKNIRVPSAPISSPEASSLAERTREIDEIFSQCNNNRTPASHQSPPDAPPASNHPDQVVGASQTVVSDIPSKKASKKRKTVSGGDRAVAAPVGKGSVEFLSKPRRKTNDGLRIYTGKELGWNRKDAGGTPLCPFDCDCCF